MLLLNLLSRIFLLYTELLRSKISSSKHAVNSFIQRIESSRADHEIVDVGARRWLIQFF